MAGESARCCAAWGRCGGGRADGERALPTVVTWWVLDVAWVLPANNVFASRVVGGGYSWAATDLGWLRFQGSTY